MFEMTSLQDTGLGSRREGICDGELARRRHLGVKQGGSAEGRNLDVTGGDGCVIVGERFHRFGMGGGIIGYGFAASLARAGIPDRMVAECGDLEVGSFESCIPGKRESPESAAKAAAREVES